MKKPTSLSAIVASSLETVFQQLSTGEFVQFLLGGQNLSVALTQATRSVEDYFFKPRSPYRGEAVHAFDSWNDLVSYTADFLSARTALENTLILLALTTFLFLTMSWASRLGNLGRFSPFARSPTQGSTTVSDADYSYITADDLKRHEHESGHGESRHEEHGPKRDTDVLVLRNKKKDYHIHFTAYSISRGELSVGHLREAAARKTNTADQRAVKLLYKGHILKDDNRTCKSEGLHNGSELLCTIADIPSASPSDTGNEDDDDLPTDGGGDNLGDGESSRRRRNRGNKTKRRNRRQAAAAQSPDGQSNLGVPQSETSSSRAPSPKPPASPATALDKLNALHAKLATYLPECDSFRRSPPADQAKKEFEHKRLSETILTQVLLQLDAVETEGDEDARAKRKELVKETQGVLNGLDAVMKS